MTTWKFFVLGRDKTPLPNCAHCANPDPSHDREACACLTCHGFYAATDDPARLCEMAKRDGHWAVRTGAASGIIVLDAEGTGSPSGVEVLDGWESWSGGWPLAPTELIAATPSGGVHRFYSYEVGVRSRNRVLPGIDIKSDGGYVLVPPAPGRHWIRRVGPGVVTGAMLEWLRTARGRHTAREGFEVGHTTGYNYHAILRNGCPGGMRDEFFNELIFRFRKADMSYSLAYLKTREHWERCAQPDRPIDGVPAIWYMPWHHVEYKLQRIYASVEPEVASDDQRRWVQALGAVRVENVTTQVDNGPRLVGRMTMIPRGGE